MQLASKLETVTHDPAKSDIHYTYIHTYVCTYVDTYTYARMCIYICTMYICSGSQSHIYIHAYIAIIHS